MTHPHDAPDLSQWDDDYDGTEAAAEHNFDDITDGDYDVVLESLAITTAKGTGSPLVKFTMKIEGPNFVGRKLWTNDGIATKQNLEYLKKDLTLIGYVGKLSQLAAHVDEFRGVRLRVRVKNKAGSNFPAVYLNKRLGDAPVMSAPDEPPPAPSSDLDPSDPVPF